MEDHIAVFFLETHLTVTSFYCRIAVAVHASPSPFHHSPQFVFFPFFSQCLLMAWCRVLPLSSSVWTGRFHVHEEQGWFPSGRWAEAPFSCVTRNRRVVTKAFLMWGEGPGFWQCFVQHQAWCGAESCNMSDCGFMKLLLCLTFSLVLSWNRTGFVCPCSVPWLKCLPAVPRRLWDLLSETGLHDRDQPQAGCDLPLWFWVLFGNTLCGVLLLWWCLAWCSSQYAYPNLVEGNGFPLTSIGFGVRLLIPVLNIRARGRF